MAVSQSMKCDDFFSTYPALKRFEKQCSPKGICEDSKKDWHSTEAFKACAIVVGPAATHALKAMLIDTPVGLASALVQASLYIGESMQVGIAQNKAWREAFFKECRKDENGKRLSSLVLTDNGRGELLAMLAPNIGSAWKDLSCEEILQRTTAYYESSQRAVVMSRANRRANQRTTDQEHVRSPPEYPAQAMACLSKEGQLAAGCYLLSSTVTEFAGSLAFGKAMGAIGEAFSRVRATDTHKLLYSGRNVDFRTEYHIGDPLPGQKKVGSAQYWKDVDFKEGVRASRDEYHKFTSVSEDGKYVELTSPSNVKTYFRVESRIGKDVTVVQVGIEETPFKTKPFEIYKENSTIQSLKGRFDPNSISSEALVERLFNAQSPASSSVQLNKGALANVRSMVEKVVAKMRSGDPLSVDDLKEWNTIVNRGIYPQAMTGIVRGTSQNVEILVRDGRITDRRIFDFSHMDSYGGSSAGIMFRYVPAGEVPERLQRIVDRVNSLGPQSNLRDVAEIYQQFIITHPFIDGNGRVGRAIVDYAFSRLRLPPLPEGAVMPSEVLYQSADDLARALQAAYGQR